jgi:hypothetical protein
MAFGALFNWHQFHHVLREIDKIRAASLALTYWGVTFDCMRVRPIRLGLDNPNTEYRKESTLSALSFF